MILVVPTAISIRVCSRIHVLAALPLASLDVKGSLTLSTLPSELCVCVRACVCLKHLVNLITLKNTQF